MTAVELLSFSMRAEPPKAGADWFRIVQAKKGETAKVYIYDEIGYWGTNAKDFAAQLLEIDADDIELHVNSPGGSVFDGLAIMSAIKSHKAKVVGYVDGMAASAASFILQACDERLMTRNAMVMIHDAKAYAGGSATQMRKAADLLDKISDDIADIYAVRSGQGTVASWRAIMVAGDEWYDGNEAVAAGLVDAVIDNPLEDDDEPEEASENSWSTEEVEAFFKTPPAKLAASAKHISVTNRVEEAPMTGINPQNVTPPAAQQPPVPAAQQVTFPENLAGFVVENNGNKVLDMQAVSKHIGTLEAFRKDTIESGRKEFVASLVKDGKIMADDKTLTATESLALSLSPEQFAQWKASMDSAPVSNLFQPHGATMGDLKAPRNGGSDKDVADRISTLEDIVQSHRDSGMSEERIQSKDSYKELQNLKSQQTGS